MTLMEIEVNQWRSKEVNGNERNSLEIIGYQRNCREIEGNQRSSDEIIRNSRKPKQIKGTQRESKEIASSLLHESLPLSPKSRLEFREGHLVSRDAWFVEAL